MIPSWKSRIVGFIVFVLCFLLGYGMFEMGTISRIVGIVLTAALCYLVFCAPDTLLEKIIPRCIWEKIVK